VQCLSINHQTLTLNREVNINVKIQDYTCEITFSPRSTWSPTYNLVSQLLNRKFPSAAKQNLDNKQRHVLTLESLVLILSFIHIVCYRILQVISLYPQLSPE